MKSHNYSETTVQAILTRLEGQDFLAQLGLSNGDFVASPDEIRSFCPVCHDRSKMTFLIERDTKRAYCTNLSCQASSMNAGGGNLAELYALAKGLDFDGALAELGTALSVPLEQQGTDEAVDACTEADFQYIEVGHMSRTDDDEHPLKSAAISIGGKEGVGRGVYIQLDDLEEFLIKYRTDVYRSHFAFDTDDKGDIHTQVEQGKLNLLGDFYITFNASSSAEIVHAINQAIDLVERLKDNYDIPYDAVRVYYTNRNIEVHVDYTVFSIQPTSMMHEIYRRMACAIIGVDPLKPERSAAFSQIDLNVYRHDYMYNIPGTQLTTSGRDIYKIRMSYAAFKKMSYQRLHEFSLRRPDLPERERWSTPSVKAREFYNSVKTSLVKDTTLDESDKIASLFYRTSFDSTGSATVKELAPTLLRRLFDESRQVLNTPSRHLDRTLGGGMYPGHLYVLAGNPGSGTSSLALQMMNMSARDQDANCLFVGFQHGVEELFKISLSSIGSIPGAEIDLKRQNPTELYDDKEFNRRIFSAYEQYQQYADRITILEGAAACNLNHLTRLIQDKKEECRAASGHSGNLLLVVDSLQLMVAMMRSTFAEEALTGETTTTGTQLSRWDVDTLTSRLKAMARELDITVLATFEHYISHRGLFSDISENDPAARQLLYNTQFADAVIVLNRQGVSLLNLQDYFKSSYTGTPREREIEPIFKELKRLEQSHCRTAEFESLDCEFIVLDVVKNRNGMQDKILMIHNKPISSFETLEYLKNGD